MAIQNFDQLNNKAIKWYDKMEIPQAEKKRRSDLAMEFCEIIVMLFALVEGNHKPKNCKEFAEERLRIIANKYVGKNNLAYVNDWSRKEADRIVDVTFKHMDDEQPEDDENSAFEFPELGIRISKDEYWTSQERGLLVGIECATITANFDDLSRALDSGKTRKTWVTEADDKVRKTHEEVHGQELPINEYFLVGNSYMLFPGDMSRDAEEKEICGCRCHCEFF